MAVKELGKIMRTGLFVRHVPFVGKEYYFTLHDEPDNPVLFMLQTPACNVMKDNSEVGAFLFHICNTPEFSKGVNKIYDQLPEVEFAKLSA